MRRIARVYKSLTEEPSPVVEKWHTRLNTVISTDGWKKIFVLHRHSGLESKFQWLQIRIIQNILGTNRLMNIVNPTEFPSPLCTFCNEESETSIHLFTECPVTNKTWKELEAWLQGKGTSNLTITRLMKLLGATFMDAKDPVNICLLITRFYIWFCRCSKTTPTFNGLENYLRFYLKAVRVCYYYQGREDHYKKLWETFAEWLG